MTRDMWMIVWWLEYNHSIYWPQPSYIQRYLFMRLFNIWTRLCIARTGVHNCPHWWPFCITQFWWIHGPWHACNVAHGWKDDVRPNLLDKSLIEYLFSMLQVSNELICQYVVDTLARLVRDHEHDATVLAVHDSQPLGQFWEVPSKADHYNLGYLCNRQCIDNNDHCWRLSAHWQTSVSPFIHNPWRLARWYFQLQRFSIRFFCTWILLSICARWCKWKTRMHLSQLSLYSSRWQSLVCIIAKQCHWMLIVCRWCVKGVVRERCC